MTRPTIDELSEMYSSDELLHAIYLDYVNNYISPQRFAEDIGLEADDVIPLLDLVSLVAERRATATEGKLDPALDVSLEVWRVYRRIRWPLMSITMQSKTTPEEARRLVQAELGSWEGDKDAIQQVASDLDNHLQALALVGPATAQVYTVGVTISEKRTLDRNPGTAFVTVDVNGIPVRLNREAKMAYVRVTKSHRTLNFVMEW